MKAMIIVAGIVFVAELGCVLRSACFASQYGKLPVLLGTLLGTAFTVIIGIFLGYIIGKSLPHSVAHWLPGLILIVIGIYMIVGEHSCHIQ